jgi:hypothetical protein
LPLPLPLFFFCVFGPEIACQAPKPFKLIKRNNIRVACQLSSLSYNRDSKKESRKPCRKVRAFSFNSKGMKTLQNQYTDCKDFTPHRKLKSTSKHPAMKTLHTFDRVGELPLQSRIEPKHA